MTFKEYLGITLAAPFIAVGYTAGFVVKVLRLAWAAIVEGYRRGSKL